MTIDGENGETPATELTGLVGGDQLLRGTTLNLFWGAVTIAGFGVINAREVSLPGAGFKAAVK